MNRLTPLGRTLCAQRPVSMPARGAALLIVLWLIALLTAVVGGFALTARVEHMQGRVLSRGVAADEAARAGLEYAMTRVVELDPLRQWPPNGSEQSWAFGDAEVTISIVDETGKVDLNATDATLMAELIRVVGGQPDQARRLASAIIDWRDPDILSQPEGGAEDVQYAAAGLPYGAKDAPFEIVAELELLLGMSPELYRKLAPYVTVYSGQPRPSQEYAQGPVLQAMGVNPEPILEQRRRPRLPGEGGGLVGAGTGTYSIESRARLRDGRIAVLRAVVRTGNSGVPGSAYTPLRWEQGVLPR